jgi:hypothetical protein
MRLSDKELRAALATVIARVGTPEAQRLADDLLNDRVSADIFDCAELLDLDGNDLVRKFSDEVHEQTGCRLVPAGTVARSLH